MKVDLHLHTSFSDGILTPESLVLLAKERNVQLMSVTDHDCLDGLEAASNKAEELGIAFIDGVELNTIFQKEEVHILGYRFDRENQIFQERLLKQRQSRMQRLNKMLQKLKELGFDLDESRVHELAGPGAVGRPHLALALMEKNLVGSVDEAFKKYLGYGKPAWVGRDYWTPQFAITAIHEAGGLAVLAHPERGGKALIHELKEVGLDGLEAYYPSHTPAITEELCRLAVQDQLFLTVGSDYHGINPGEKGPGSVEVPREVIEELLRIFCKR